MASPQLPQALYAVYSICALVFVVASLAVLWFDLPNSRHEEVSNFAVSALTVGLTALISLAATRIYSDSVRPR